MLILPKIDHPAHFSPYLSLYWLVAGKTLGGMSLYPDGNRFDRAEALRLFTLGSAWFSSEEDEKGAITTGQLADLAVLSADYFSIPEEDIKHLESVLTVVGGKVVYASAEFSKLAPPPLQVSPDWSPVKRYGGYQQPKKGRAEAPVAARSTVGQGARQKVHRWVLGDTGLWSLGCDCFAF